MDCDVDALAEDPRFYRLLRSRMAFINGKANFKMMVSDIMMMVMMMLMMMMMMVMYSDVDVMAEDPRFYRLLRSRMAFMNGKANFKMMVSSMMM